MSLAIDAIVSNFFFTLSLLPHLVPPARGASRGEPKVGHPLPFVSVIVALYGEPAADIEMTLLSLIGQSYPVDRYEILFALEPSDETGVRLVSRWLKALGNIGVAGRIVLSDGKVRTKPHALNRALLEARGEYCAFYDAADRIDSDQIEKTIRLMEEESFDVGQARVLRSGSSLLSRFLLLDTCIWYWKYMPVLLRLCDGFPLSGEGLFIRKAVLEETRGFPEVLTEDALLGLMLTARHKRFVLVDSTVIEKAPRSVRAHFRQKLRWHRGYLTCLRRLVTSKMPTRQKCVLGLPFCVPIVSGMAFVGWLLIISSLASGLAGHDVGISPEWLERGLVADWLYYWSLALAYIGIPLVVGSSIHALWCASMIRSAPIALLLPLYWIFVGACSVSALFRGTTHWVRTERESRIEATPRQFSSNWR